MKKNLIVILLFVFLASCGRNDPSIPGKNNRNADAGLSSCGAKSGVISKSNHWQVAPLWTIGPRMGGEDLVENAVCLVFSDSEGNLAQSLTGVQLTAWMPEHGHDTGNEKPLVGEISKGEVRVSNIWFIMTGNWELIVKAIVNGQADEARISVVVPE